MDEELRLSLADSVEPCPRFLVVPPQAFVLLHRPPDQVLVYAQCKERQLGAIEGSIIVGPAPHLRIDVLSEAGQVRPTTPVEVPSPDLLAFRLLCTDAHGR